MLTNEDIYELFDLFVCAQAPDSLQKVMNNINLSITEKEYLLCCSMDDYDSVIMKILLIAMNCAQYSSDFCDLAVAFHTLTSSDDLRDKALREALKAAKIPADFEEISRTEKQIKEACYANGI